MASAAENALKIRGVSKSYGATRALDEVDLTVEAGEFVVLLGPNGAGKSTLFQIVSGLFVPDAGEVEIAGRNLRRDAVAVLAQIGIVFQQPTLDLELSVRANLRFHARLHGLSRRLAEERIAAELARFDLADRADDPARSLSGGNRRRAELARALLHDPRFLLMDEATVGLDPPSRRDILDHVHRLRSEARVGVLWATHLVDEAKRADRVIVLNQGRLLLSGSPQELVARIGSADLDDAFLALLARSGPASAAQAAAS